MNPDNIIFTAVNSDREITYTLKEGIPYSFGKQHIENSHEDLKGKMGAVKKTVESPDIIYRDPRHHDRERIYCSGADSTRPSMYVKVIAEYTSDNEANIITAWTQKEISPTEGKIIYVKSKL